MNHIKTGGGVALILFAGDLAQQAIGMTGFPGALLRVAGGLGGFFAAKKVKLL